MWNRVGYRLANFAFFYFTSQIQSSLELNSWVELAHQIHGQQVGPMTRFEILVSQKGGEIKNGQHLKQNMFSRLKFSADFISEVKNT